MATLGTRTRRRNPCSLLRYARRSLSLTLRAAARCVVHVSSFRVRAQTPRGNPFYTGQEQYSTTVV